MTGKDLALQLKVKLNRLDTASNRTLRPEVALVFLNDVYKKLVRSKYKKNITVADETTFQNNQLITDELNYLSVPKEVDVLGGGTGVPYFVNISEFEDYMVHLNSSIRTNVTGKESWCYDPEIVTLDQLGYKLNDPFNKPVFGKPILYFEENKIKFPHDGTFQVTKYKMTYLKFPETITLEDDVLAPFTEEIVDKAVVAILENWKDQRTQSKLSTDKLLNSE